MRKKMMLAVACATVTGMGAWAMGIAPAPTMQPEAAAVPQSQQSGAAMAHKAGPDAAFVAKKRELDARVARQSALDVGDADSFGRPVRWLGLLSMRAVQLRRDCTPMPGDPADARCLQITDPMGSGYGSYRDVAHITLPGGSLNSVLCHWGSSTIDGAFVNETPYNNSASLTMYPSITLESEVLGKLALTNPDTGQPMDGTLELYPAPAELFAALSPGEVLNFSQPTTRTCVGGLITRRTLVEYYGLSDRQVDRVLARPITLRLNVDVMSFGLYAGNAGYSVRFVGD
jgi:hypothetical protein